MESTYRIHILSYQGAQRAAVLGLFDLLSTASLLCPNTSLDVTILEHDDLPSDNAPEPDALIVPPSLGGLPDPATHAAWSDWILAQHARGTVLCSVCVGAFWLAALGVLNGRPATTHWELAEPFQARFPSVHVDADRLFIDDGDVITAGGVMAWIDLGLHLIGRYLGPATLLATARRFIVDPGGREQRFYRSFVPITTHGDEPILAAQRFMQTRLAESVSMKDTAAHVGLAPRTFMRRFQKATGMRSTSYLQHVRVHRARELLESTERSLQEIAWAVGYEDPGALRKVFERLIGLTPAAYRRRFHPTLKTTPP